MLLPLRYNDGREVDPELFEQTRQELIAQFGALCIQPNIVKGTWVHEGTRYEDDLLRYVLDVDETPENQQFFADFKTLLLERFAQIEIYIVSYPVDVL